jgi:hypothetical protein
MHTETQMTPEHARKFTRSSPPTASNRRQSINQFGTDARAYSRPN